MPGIMQKLEPRLSEAGRSAMSALKIPVVESAAGAAVGALLFRALSGLSTNVLVRDPYARDRINRASWILGAVIGGANPIVRDADFSSPGAFFQSIGPAHSASSDIDMVPFLGTISVPQAASILREDAFLHPYERESAISVVRSAEQTRPGLTSQYNLTRAAIKAGVSFVPAYAFGTLAGRVLGLSGDTAKRISQIGALAYAVRASGLADELR